MRHNGSIGHPHKDSVVLACDARLMTSGTSANDWLKTAAAVNLTCVLSGCLKLSSNDILHLMHILTHRSACLPAAAPDSQGHEHYP